MCEAKHSTYVDLHNQSLPLGSANSQNNHPSSAPARCYLGLVCSRFSATTPTSYPYRLPLISCKKERRQADSLISCHSSADRLCARHRQRMTTAWHTSKTRPGAWTTEESPLLSCQGVLTSYQAVSDAYLHDCRLREVSSFLAGSVGSAKELDEV